MLPNLCTHLAATRTAPSVTPATAHGQVPTGSPHGRFSVTRTSSICTSQKSVRTTCVANISRSGKESQDNVFSSDSSNTRTSTLVRLSAHDLSGEAIDSTDRDPTARSSSYSTPRAPNTRPSSSHPSRVPHSIAPSYRSRLSVSLQSSHAGPSLVDLHPQLLRL